MGYFLYQLRRLVTLPLSLFTTPTEGLRTTWKESDRNKSMLLGIPSLVVALLALAAFMYAQFGNSERLEDRYKSRYEEASRELSQIAQDLAQRQQVMRVGNNPDAAQASEEEKSRIKELNDAQKIYLDKLISLAPDNDQYRFNLAQIAQARGNGAHALSIIRQLAPEDAPGYPDAHYALAQRFFRMPSQSRASREVNLELAMTHINHMLTRDEKNIAAKLLKGRVLALQSNYVEAYDIFLELFEEEPGYYAQLIELNKLIGSPDRDNQILETALIKFQQSLNDPLIQEDDRKWTACQRGITRTMQLLNRHEQLEGRLTTSIGELSATEGGGARRVFLQRRLAESYMDWARQLAQEASGRKSLAYNLLPEPTQLQLVELFRRAYKNDPRNPLVLQFLAQLALSKNQRVADTTREIYDPFADTNAPATVLSQMGNAAMADQNYDRAIFFYEKARDKESRSPMILNNLAFSYLVSKDTNAERALQLTNEALRNLAANTPSDQISVYLHTKGTALKQLNRLQEAVSVFERSLKDRPDHADTLRSVVECYEGLGLRPPERYIERLENILKLSDPVLPNNP